MTIANKLRILKSDLADCTNPKILKKYPHLASQQLIDHLKSEISRLEGQS
jgi:hypothetical protein